ncbi:SDR family oxidoreductase [Mycolicibacterium komossense]|jgi:3-oxoacyl-[acyl-carrier protein] reductase|uniref:SDR family oxidoreductase n=1 Tax=Mycolicibacterium komossense TaxID=1779 RepID=A0ABT3CEZ4_9MYCO|nr:SDR family oxidoreductase [Mycolicibacterium komossense]MCV7227967.1 SDR family oxidoreductase [Mycolicibacterium komossense]
MHQQPARIVLVTGASRGIGADVAQQLASPDTHVVVNYREDAVGAGEIVGAIRRAGGQASTLAADICDESDAAAMIDAIAVRFGRLDALILNASGGLGAGVDPGYAMRINRDAQRHLARLAVPLMPADGRIVFVTSHQAHFFPNKAVPKGYSAVAASKRAGETALYAMRSVFNRAGVHLTVVSGDLTDGTIVAGTDFADAIADAANTPNARSIVYVGGANHLAAA